MCNDVCLEEHCTSKERPTQQQSSLSGPSFIFGETVTCIRHEHFIPISDPGRTRPFWILQGSWWPWCIEPPNIPPELRRWSHLSRAKWSLQHFGTSRIAMYCPRISDSRVSTAPEGSAFLAWTRSKRWARWAQSAQGLAWTSKENNGNHVVRNVVENVC